ncbi:MAG: enolase C-terminal domain-like protein [Acetobacterales bacterium]
MKISEIVVRLAKFPLTKPYRVSYRVYEDFDPIIVVMRDEDGRVAWGEGHISPGYSHETIEGGWAYALQHAASMLGKTTDEARAVLPPEVIAESPCAATALLTCIDMLEWHPLLDIPEETRLPLLEPIGAKTVDAVPDEIEELLGKGFRTLKLKVGFDVDADLAKLAAVQKAVAGRAQIRLDANRAFSAEDGRRFAANLDPEGVQLFEQPCDSKDWAANAAVAEVSRVPVMMDESIYGLSDIDRAGRMKGVGFVKLKLKKFGSMDLLKEGLDRIASNDLTRVLGDGTSTELNCWLEGCVARVAIDNAGEFNGYLKPKARLFADPLPFDKGDMVLPKGYRPVVDEKVLEAHTVRSERIAPAKSTGFRAAE